MCIWINGQYNENDEIKGKPTKLFSKSSNLKLNDLMVINNADEQQKDDEENDLKGKSKELWIFQFDNDLDVVQKELEILTGIAFLFKSFILYKLLLLLLLYYYYYYIIIIIYIYILYIFILLLLLLLLFLNTLIIILLCEYGYFRIGKW